MAIETRSTGELSGGGAIPHRFLHHRRVVMVATERDQLRSKEEADSPGQGPHQEPLHRGN